MICHGALVNGEIDIYPEYTGTGLTTVLHRKPLANPLDVYNIVLREYAEQYGLEWLAPFGINNTYTITVRDEDASQHRWEKVSDLESSAANCRAGFTAEFAERPDGYSGFQKTYGFDFGQVTDIDAGLMYDAIASGEVDVIAAFATDGRIKAYNLRPLIDDRSFFPPYYAAPVVRRATLSTHPELRDVLARLGNTLDDVRMQELNFLVDHEKHAPAKVAREFLVSQGLLDKD